jgi:tRNA(fMet)-specific endonuclease VapC
MILLDSDHLSVLLDERDARSAALSEHLDSSREETALPIVCIEEFMRGWLAAIRRNNDPHQQIRPYRRLKNALTRLREWPIVDWDESAAHHLNRLRAARVRIGAQDLKIACIALANDALLLSANLRDFEQVPGLRAEDWLA